MANKKVERWLIWQAIQDNNRRSAEQSVLDNRAEAIQRYNQSQTDFTGLKGFGGDYDANPMLGLFDLDTSTDIKKRKRTGGV